MCTCNFDGDPTFRGPIRDPYTSLCKSCYHISSVAKYHRDPIIVLYCRPHSQVVHVPVWLSQNARDPKRGNSWKFTPPPSPIQIGSGKLVFEKKFLPTNQMHWSDLKGCMKKCRCFRCHLKVYILTRFGIFCRFGLLYTYNGYNKFDWLTLVLRPNWTCRIWFGILSSRAFCIVVSDFAHLLPFSNNFPLKYLKNINLGFTLVHIPTCNKSACSINMGLLLKLL